MKALKAIAAALLAGACAPDPAADEVHVTGPCEAPVAWAVLPDDVGETSGVAASRAHAGVFWTHNDSGGDSAVFALDSTGTLLGRVRVRGAGNRDWEDIAVGPCDPGAGDECLFIGDIGDNSERRSDVVIYRVPEPDPRTDTLSAVADRIEATYPEGPRDSEALFVTRDGIHLVTKGRSQSVELFRLPPPYRSGSSAPLVRLQELAPPPTSVTAQVTGAAATRDGRLVVIRSYSGLRFFQADADSLLRVGEPADFLGPGQQPQGEGVDFMSPDRLVLTGEAGGRAPATLAAVRCHPRPAPEDSIREG